MDIDAREVIYEVKKRRPLWDLFDKKNVDKMLIIRLWEEIAVELDAPTIEIKKKWKNLRDTYRMVLKRDRSGMPKKPWKHMTEMAFLKDVMMSDPLHGGRVNCSEFEYNYEQTNTNTSIEESLDELLTPSSEQNRVLKNELIDESSSDSSFKMPMKTNAPKEPTPSPQKKKRILADLKKVTREREKVEQQPVEKKTPSKKTTEDEIDGDYNFLTSFLPIMKEMTSIQKLEFRAQMSNVTLNIMRPTTSVSNDIGFEDPSSSCLQQQNWK